MSADYYYTIQNPITNEWRVKGSRFLGYAAPVKSQDQAEELIKSQRQKFHDATHHCFAYRIGVGEEPYFRYSDAGEPNGTAGRPIYQAIVGRELTNILVVVTRYFGGIKLGTGGLARAYCDTAKSLLQNATIVTEYIMQEIQAIFSYTLLNNIMHVLNQTKTEVVDSKYEEQICLRLWIRKGQAENLQRKLIEATAGKITIVLTPEAQ